MAPTQQQEEDDEDDIMDPIRILLPDHQIQSVQNAAVNQHHHIPSMELSILIRELPSQGLSFQLWPAATTLVTLLDRHRSDPASSPLSPVIASVSSDAPLNVLELGSGTGLVGIAAALTLGANVTVTDLPHVIPNLQFNVDVSANAVMLGGGSVDVAALRWGEESNVDLEVIAKDFDLILASDVIYHAHLYEPLLCTLGLIMGGENKKKKKMFVMAHLRRWKKDSFFFKKAKKLFDVEVIHADRPREGSRVGVVVYRFAQKNKKLLAGLAQFGCYPGEAAGGVAMREARGGRAKCFKVTCLLCYCSGL